MRRRHLPARAQARWPLRSAAPLRSCSTRSSLPSLCSLPTALCCSVISSPDSCPLRIAHPNTSAACAAASMFHLPIAHSIAVFRATLAVGEIADRLGPRVAYETGAMLAWTGETTGSTVRGTSYEGRFRCPSTRRVLHIAPLRFRISCWFPSPTLLRKTN